MNPRLVEFALRKQRLQFRAEAERADMARRLAGIEATLDRVDTLRDGFAWAREKVPLLSVAALVVLVARPRLTLRLVKRGWIGWLVLHRLRGRKATASLLPLVAPLLQRLLAALRRALDGSATRG